MSIHVRMRMEARKLRIVFMGTPEFAVESLRALVESGHQVVGVVTAPDRPAGRGLKVSESAVKKYAVSVGLPVLQPEKLKNPGFLRQLAALNPDLQVVVAFRMLPEVVWAAPRLGTFNLHASLLPQYRGAAPLNWALIHGETETGVTTFLLSHEIDTGQILFREKEPIHPSDTVGDLHDRLMLRGARLVVKTVEALATGDYAPVPQEALISAAGALKAAPKIFREDMHISWNAPAEQVRNLIRGLSPWPAAWTTLRHRAGTAHMEMKIYGAETGAPGVPSTPGETNTPGASQGPLKTGAPAETTIPPGTIRTDGKRYLEVACADGWLRITDLQLSGRKRMKTEEFLRGFPGAEEFRAE